MAHLVQNDILIPEISRLLSEGRDVRFTPSGVSMRPFIEGGHDTVVLRKPLTVRVGDIALVRVTMGIPATLPPERQFVLHRVIDITDGVITLMGDGNLRGHEQCRTEDVLGIVVRIESPRGWRKPATRGWLWQRLLPWRWLLLKVYRHLPCIQRLKRNTH